MLQIIIHIFEVDYSAIAEVVVPIILENKKSSSNSGKLKTVISKIQNLSGPAVSAALRVLPQNIKDDIAVSIVQNYENQILQKMNDLLAEKQLLLAVKDIEVAKKDNIEICLIFDEIDYTALISTAYPQIVHRGNTNEKFIKIFSILDKLGNKSTDVIHATLGVLSQDEKDEIVSCIISAYEQEIITVVNTFATEKKIKVSIGGVEIRKI